MYIYILISGNYIKCVSVKYYVLLAKLTKRVEKCYISRGTYFLN